MAENAVEVEGLVKRFGKLTALEGIDFQIPRGTIFGLLGPNGAGKTTAVRILATILRPDAGRAAVLGRDVSKQPQEVRHLIGLAGQAAAVDPNLTGRENLGMIGILAQIARKEAKRRTGELLERFGLADAADRPAAGYSGGMRRRLDVAAALVARPPVLFLDEPTTGLDIQSRTQLWEVIRELVAEGATVLLTTQYLEEADRLAERIAVVDRGRVIANDTPAGLKARLGGTVVEFGMESEADAAAAERVVSQISPEPAARDGALVRFSSIHGPKLLVEVLRRLDGRGLLPATLSVREPSLDDVFLSLTGPQKPPGDLDRHGVSGSANLTSSRIDDGEPAAAAGAARDGAGGAPAGAAAKSSGAMTKAPTTHPTKSKPVAAGKRVASPAKPAPAKKATRAGKTPAATASAAKRPPPAAAARKSRVTKKSTAPSIRKPAKGTETE